MLRERLQLRYGLTKWCVEQRDAETCGIDEKKDLKAQMQLQRDSKIRFEAVILFNLVADLVEKAGPKDETKLQMNMEQQSRCKRQIIRRASETDNFNGYRHQSKKRNR
jgi:hypothetical protein